MPDWMLDHTGLIAAVSVVTVGLFAVGLILYSVHVRKEEQKAKLAATATFVSSFVLTILTSVFLSNLFAQKRDRDQRVWNLSQQHLVRLKPVLRLDADRYDSIINGERVSGHVGLNAATMEKELDSLFAPDILSSHLLVHFPEYYQRKQSLRNEVKELDEEFNKTLELVRNEVKLPATGESRRVEVAQAVLQRCLKKGFGISLVIQESSYNYLAVGSTTGGTGRPSPDMVAAFKAFQTFRDSKVQSQCDDMLRRGEVIIGEATKLKQEVLILAELTILPNSCEYVKP
jgi:hypothetical protein